MTAPHSASTETDAVGGSLFEDGLRPLPTAAEHVEWHAPAPSLPGRLTETQLRELWCYAALRNRIATGHTAICDDERWPVPERHHTAPRKLSTLTLVVS